MTTSSGSREGFPIFSLSRLLSFRSAEEEARQLEFARHHELCTAIPFPELNWENKKLSEQNLVELYVYTENVANSAIDWYNRKRRWKKAWSVTLRFLVFLFAVLGVLVPFLKFAGPGTDAKILQSLVGHILEKPTAPEVALILFGVAVGFYVIDRYAGFSAGWMRYTLSAMQISDGLMKFQFQWNEIERDAALEADRQQANPPSSNNEVTPSSRSDKPGIQATKQDQDKAPTDTTTRRINLATEFCSNVFKIVREETSAWADEIKDGMSFVEQAVFLRSGSGGRPTGNDHGKRT